MNCHPDGRIKYVAASFRYSEKNVMQLCYVGADGVISVDLIDRVLLSSLDGIVKFNSGVCAWRASKPETSTGPPSFPNFLLCITYDAGTKLGMSSRPLAPSPIGVETIVTSWGYLLKLPLNWQASLVNSGRTGRQSDAVHATRVDR